MKEYTIWWKRHSEKEWRPTAHSVKARTDNEAQTKTRKMFSGAGFSSMSLVAVIKGNSPTL